MEKDLYVNLRKGLDRLTFVTISPNPATDYLVVTLRNSESIRVINVYDSNGILRDTVEPESNNCELRIT